MSGDILYNPDNKRTGFWKIMSAAEELPDMEIPLNLLEYGVFSRRT